VEKAGDFKSPGEHNGFDTNFRANTGAALPIDSAIGALRKDLVKVRLTEHFPRLFWGSIHSEIPRCGTFYVRWLTLNQSRPRRVFQTHTLTQNPKTKPSGS